MGIGHFVYHRPKYEHDFFWKWKKTANALCYGFVKTIM